MSSKSNHSQAGQFIRGLCACLGLAAVLVSGSERAVAAEWPTRPVTVIVPYAAGGNTDMMARLASRYLASKLGQSFVVDNRAGGGGSIGAIAVAKAQPDGYTLLFGAGTQIVNIPMLQKVVYSEKDFAPISIFGAGPYLLGIKSSLPVNTLSEFIAYVKERPGKLNYATAGIGGNVHLNTALFISRAGLDMTMIPYRSGAPAMAGLVAGEVDMYFGNASELMLHTETKQLKIIAVSTRQRIAQLPNIPAVAETFPGFDTSSWNGYLAPAGTPPAIIETIESLTMAAAKQPEIVERLNQLAIVPFGTTRAEFRKAIEQAKVINRESIKAAGLPTIN